MTVALLEVVKGMALIPHSCILCANNPVDIEGNQQEAIFAPGVDVNFGDSVYICAACADIISDLRGRVTKHGFDQLTEKYETLKDKHEELENNYERVNTILTRIKDGKKALSEVKGPSNQPKTKKKAA